MAGTPPWDAIRQLWSALGQTGNHELGDDLDSDELLSDDGAAAMEPEQQQQREIHAHAALRMHARTPGETIAPRGYELARDLALRRIDGRLGLLRTSVRVAFNATRGSAHDPTRTPTHATLEELERALAMVSTSRSPAALASAATARANALSRLFAEVRGEDGDAALDVVATAGGDVLWRALEISWSFYTAAGAATSGEVDAGLATTPILCLAILKEMVYGSEPWTRRFAARDDLALLLFRVLAFPICYDHAAAVLEELLALRPDMFDLTTVPALDALVASLSPRRLSVFCRLLTLVLVDPADRVPGFAVDVFASRRALLAHTRARTARPSATNRNHARAHAIDSLLPRLVTLLALPIDESALAEAPHDMDGSALMMLIAPMFESDEWCELEAAPAGAPADSPVGSERAGDAEAGSPDDGKSRRGAAREREVALAGRWFADARGLGRASVTAAAAAAAAATRTDRSPTAAYAYATAEAAEEAIAAVAAATRRRPAVGLSPLPARPRPLRGSPMYLAYTMRMHALATHRVEVLYVVCTLLSRHRRADAQLSFALAGLVPVLERLVRLARWQLAPPPEGFVGPHGPNCQCAPESALSSQLLLVAHHFADVRGPLRLLFWNDAERREMGLPLPRGAFADRGSQADEGLIVTLVRLLVREPLDSPVRFSLASAIEAFTRNASLVEKRTLLGRVPLLAHLVDSIARNKSAQSSFDLLAELIRYNLDALAELGATRAVAPAQWTDFVATLEGNLVDSNVLIRAIAVTMTRVRDISLERPGAAPYPTETCCLVALLRERGRDLLKRLIDGVVVEDLTQDNMSCLNTSLVLLRILPDDAEALLTSDECASTRTSLRAALRFFVLYYRVRGGDALLLCQSTGIALDEWLGMAEALLVRLADDDEAGARASGAPSNAMEL